jgi:MFS family permease
MPSPASLTPGDRRAQRPAIAQLLSMWRALPGSVRRFASDFAAVFVQEGRQVSARMAWAALALAVAGILVLAGWLLVCAATVSWAVSAHGWPWERALYLAALLNLLLAVISIVAANRWLKSPLFPVTSYELRRLRSTDSHAPLAEAATSQNRPPTSSEDPKERALMRSEAELQARILQVKRATPQLLTAPSVIAATAGAGMLLGLVTSKRKRQTTTVSAGPAANVPATKQLVNVAFGQLSSLALAVALRELQRRAGHDR